MSMITVTQSRRRSTDKHRAILTAAAALVARSGYKATSLEGVAAEAGVGKQTIYRWWPSKAALFVEVYRDLVPPERLRTDGPDARARLGSLLQSLFALYRDTAAGDVLTGLLSEAATEAAARDALREGLVLDRADLVERLVEGTCAAPATANEIVISIVWQRLVTRPWTLDDGFARHLADIAVRAAADRR